MTRTTSLTSAFRKTALIVLLLSCFLFGSHSAAQSPGSRDPRSASEIEWENQQRANAQKKLSEQRQRDIQNDTDKLLQLATELKQYVDKTDKNTMSVDVIKKADEIEKLAKAVRDKMKGQ